MKIILIDNEIHALNILERVVREAVPDSEITCFNKVSELLQNIREGKINPDIAFMDIEMPGITGLELAKVLKGEKPNVNIIFVTGYSQYALEAMTLRPSGYIMKPATKQKVLDELNNLRHPPLRTVKEKLIKIRCFGNFDVFVNNEPVQFLRAKSKELLAYLVDRHGASCTTTEVASILWEDGIYNRSRQKQISVIRNDLIKSLKQVNSHNIIIKGYNALSVDINAFDCDYYMALDGDVPSINSFMGEYMMPYSWAEFTTGALEQKFNYI